ncbi:DUF1381 domain-containing protein [Staphylococcus sp. NRL 19/737]|nr:DUF1381 domain-containing protein [Staphylococcus sp. NRL 19/737]MCJ1668554.1 DUF1381 domain-containing protein [Staphylococcus sp. NRL 19/737]
MQYLIRQFKDSTGHIHTDIEKAKDNETLSIVEAKSKEEALNEYNTLTGLNKLEQLLFDKQIPHDLDVDDETEVLSIGNLEIVNDSDKFQVYEHLEEVSFTEEYLALTTDNVDDVIKYIFTRGDVN